MSKKLIYKPIEIAELLCVSKTTLARMRVRGDGPPYKKVNNRVFIYPVDEFNKWLKNRD